MGETVKYSISIEMEVPSYDSTRYLPDSLIVRFDKKKESKSKEVTKDHFERVVRIDNKALNDKIEPDRKLRLFVDIFHAIATENRYDVKKEIIVQELVNTGHFTEEEASAYIKKAQNGGFIFERKMGVYALA